MDRFHFKLELLLISIAECSYTIGICNVAIGISKPSIHKSLFYIEYNREQKYIKVLEVLGICIK